MIVLVLLSTSWCTCGCTYDYSLPCKVLLDTCENFTLPHQESCRLHLDPLPATHLRCRCTRLSVHQRDPQHLSSQGVDSYLSSEQKLGKHRCQKGYSSQNNSWGGWQEHRADVEGQWQQTQVASHQHWAHLLVHTLPFTTNRPTSSSIARFNWYAERRSSSGVVERR